MNVIELAKEAGFEVNYYKSLESEEVVSFDPIITGQLERFAALVAAQLMSESASIRAALKLALAAMENASPYGLTFKNEIAIAREALAEQFRDATKMVAEPVLKHRTGDCLLCGHCAATGQRIYAESVKGGI